MNQDSQISSATKEPSAQHRNPRSLEQPANKYSFAKCLRAVGQALDAQTLVSLELAYQSGIYVVRTVAAQRQQADSPLKGVMQGLYSTMGLLLGLRPAASSFTEQVEIPHSADELVHLDSVGQTKRLSDRDMPDPFSLAEKLRSVGLLIDSNPNRLLIGVSTKGDQLNICYVTETGTLREVTLAVDHQYESWKTRYLKRKNRAEHA